MASCCYLGGFLAGCLTCLQLAVSSQLTRRASLYRLISLTYLACLYSSSAIDDDTKPAEDSFSRRTQGPSSE